MDLETRSPILSEIGAHLRLVEEHLEAADPTVAQDLVVLLELARHAAGRVTRNAGLTER